MNKKILIVNCIIALLNITLISVLLINLRSKTNKENNRSSIGDYIVDVEYMINNNVMIQNTKEYSKHLAKNCLHPTDNDYIGCYNGPSGMEYYYNVPMNNSIRTMRYLGYSEEDYPYYIREDGCKMLGPYIMIAASPDLYELGDYIETSLGKGIVCDYMGSAYEIGIRDIDLATDWF